MSDELDRSDGSDGSDFEVGVSGAGASRPRGKYDAAGAGRPRPCPLLFYSLKVTTGAGRPRSIPI